MDRLPVSPPRKLFALLRYLNIDQQRLAAHLGLSHTLISLWAHGKKRIPDKHYATIHVFIQETFNTIVEGLVHKADVSDFIYRAYAREAGGEETEAMRTAMAAWKAALQACNAAFETYKSMREEVFAEWLLLSGDLHRNLYEACRTVGHYGRQQPQYLSAEARTELRRACLVIQESLRQLGQLENAPPTLDPKIEQQQRVIEEKLREVG